MYSQNLCCSFRYLVNKTLGFGVDFSVLLFPLGKLETFKHAEMLWGCCKAAYLSAGVFIVEEEIMALIKHGISKACGSLEDAM